MLLNLAELNNTNVQVQSVPFRYYYTIRILNNLESTDIPISNKEKDMIEDRISPLSSYMTVSTNNKTILCVRNMDEFGGKIWVTSPGSGYLDVYSDINDEENAKPIETILKRELKEEMNIVDWESIKIYGIFSEEISGLYINPAIFSEVNFDMNDNKLISTAQNAEDSGEFDKLVSIPHSKDIFEKIINDSVGSLKYFPNDSSVSPKLPLLLLMSGRKKFGEEWFEKTKSNSNIKF